MNIHDPKHPIWILLYQTVPASVIIILCIVLYKNGLVAKDFFLPIGVTLSQFLVALLKSKYAPTPLPPPVQE